VISTLTTVLWLASSVTQDEFYAGLGYTVIFGLVFSSVITLVAVPVIVKDLKLILNIMIRILARFVFTILPSLLIYIICYILDYHILWLVLWALIFFIMSYLYLYSIKSKRMNIIQESLWYYIDTGETVVSNNKLILRYLISLLNIIPFYLIIDVMYSFFNNRWQFIADSIFWTKAVFLTNYSFSWVDEEDYEAPILYDNISISPTIIPLWKFVLYSILTLWIYEMIRFYRHWRRIKKEKKINILCFRRAVFAGLFASSMVKHIQTLVKKEGIDYDGYPIVVGISYFFLRASRLFSSLPMLWMVSVMNKYWSLSDNLKGKTSKEVIKSKRGA
jgi:hypothetical protein